MSRLLATTAICFLILAQAVNADDPASVGIIDGQYNYEGPDVGGVTGETFWIADEAGATGSYALSAGEVNTLESGTTGAPADRTPRMGVGTATGAEGTLTVSGPGAVMRLDGNDTGARFRIGSEGGTGTVTVSDGGLLEILAPFNTNPEDSAIIQMGRSNGNGTLLLDNGTVNVSSALDAFLFMGTASAGGTSVVSLSNGSSLNITALAPIVTTASNDMSEASIVLGQSPSTESTMTVDGSTVSVTAEEGSARLSIAREAGTSGVFTLTNGSVMTLDANTSGVDTDADSGASVQIGGEEGTNGTLRIESGAQLNMTSQVDGGFVGVGFNDGAFGQLIIEGAGSLTYTSTLDDGFMQIGQDDPATSGGGVGFLTVSGTGSLLDFDGVIDVGSSTGTGSSTGIVTVSDGGHISAREVNIFDGGILKGSGGKIDATVSIFGGGLLATGTSPGTLDILGDLILGGGSNLEIEIAGTAAGQFDVLNISGNLIADDIFALTFSFLDGFSPDEGATFDFLNVSGDIQDFFDLAQISFLGIGSANPSFFADEDGRVSVSFTDVTAVPVPMSALLLISGLGAVSLLGRRKSRGVQ